MNFPVYPMWPGPRQGRGNDASETFRLARISKEAPRMPWDEFISSHFHWRQGEHVALIGPTGLGKTTMIRHLLPLMPYVVVFATKPRDDSMTAMIGNHADPQWVMQEGLKHDGYYPVKRWVSLDHHKFPRRVLWPDATSIDSDKEQSVVFHDAFAKIYREGGWCIAIDELWWVINILGLGRDVKIILLQGRALGISLLVATQRPAWIPLEVYDQSTHLFFWRDNDETNLKKLSGIAFRSKELIQSVIADLEKNQVLYVNTRTGAMFRTRSPKIAD